jgi:hypothetical protein
MGIQNFELELGNFTVIEGANGTGKSSVLGAVMSATRGGHEATLLRKGEKEARVVMEFDNGQVLTKNITETDTNTQVRDPKLGVLPAVMSYVKKLFDGSMVNPVAFIHAEQKDRVKMFLEALPVELTDEEFNRLSKDCASTNMAALRKAHPLISMAAIDKDIRAQRREINVKIREKEDTIKQVRESLPAIPEVSFIDKAEALQANLTASEQELLTKTKDIEIRKQKALGDISEDCATQRANLSKSIEAKILALKQEMADSTREINLSEEKRKDNVRTLLDSEAKTLREEMQPAITDYSTQLATARANIEIEMKAKGAREIIVKMETELNAMNDRSGNLTLVLEDLERTKLRLLEKIPVPGVEIREDDVYVGGISFKTINEAKKLEIAFQVARLRDPICPLMVVDGIERLDAANQELFEKMCREANIQTLVAGVGTPGMPLTVGNSFEQ